MTTSDRPARGARPMRILFFISNVAKTRHFEGVLEGLADHGHTIVLAAERKASRPVSLPKKLWQVNRDLAARKRRGRIELIPCPTERVDHLRTLVPALRQVRDYLRFFDPRYRDADKLEARAAEEAPTRWIDYVKARPWIGRHAPLVSRVLALVEEAVPADPLATLFTAHERPDLVIVTPLVNYGSYQTDYVKAAHALGIPVVFAPFSWDNLTNRGLVRVEPDRVLAWNDIQRREAVELHGVSPERIQVTGAPRFDEFFAMRPSSARETFLGPLGLDPAQPVILYLCSSEFVAPREVDFVARWIAALRASGDPVLRDCGVLIRPHPAHLAQWKSVDVAGTPQAALWREKESMQADQGLYDSLYHAAVVVGLNTSAMIEAGVLGKPVLTVVADEFAGGQEHTLHFHYLRASNGGLLTEARGMDDHLRQLAGVLRDGGDGRLAQAFVASFVRPNGVDEPVAPLMVEQLEKAARLRKRPRRARLWHYLVRAGLRLVVWSQERARRAERHSRTASPA